MMTDSSFSTDMTTPAKNKNALIDWWPSPAKLNLFLHIVGRYPNGYHELQSIFQLLDVGDAIGFEPSLTHDGFSLKTGINGVAESDNLVYKAAALILPYRKNTLNVDIHIKKNLPMGGGIGGGSSNAATVLVALNELWQCALSTSTLRKIGLSLGADIPFFIEGHSAFVEGIGEQIDPVELPLQYYLVATPINVHSATNVMFTHPNLPRNTQKLNKNEYTFITSRNDCEKLACILYPDVANLLQWLVHYAPSRMTGTGASVFAIFNRKTEAEELLSTLPSQYKGFVAEGINRSKLLKKRDEYRAL